MNGEKNPNYRHGGGGINRPEHNSWRAMIARCYDPKYRRFDRYGGRGIKVHDRWRGSNGFVNFLADMGKKPSSKHTIDRIDNDGDYTPDNCCWSTQKAQILNSTTVKPVTIDGVSDSITGHIARYRNASASLVYKRIRQGWAIEEAITVPSSVTRSASLAERRKKIVSQLSKCKWCNNPVGTVPSKKPNKYCNSNHYMLHRMNPSKTAATYTR